MKKFILAALFSTAFIGVASAEETCKEGVKQITNDLSSGSVKRDIKSQIEDLHSKAEKLCNEGKNQESLDIVEEARALIEIQ